MVTNAAAILCLCGAAADVAPRPDPPTGFLPNIVFVLTDDQDITLGGMVPMPKTRKLLGEQGATATNYFIHTPVCCPSRAETLTGRYFHNLKMDNIHVNLSVINTTDNGGGCLAAGNGCMCVDENKVNPYTFAVDLASVGYKVGIFGKHLNNCPKTIQPGFSRWFANGGGDFFNTQFWDDRSPTGSFTANSSFYSGYQTSILGNMSINWIREIVHGTAIGGTDSSNSSGRNGQSYTPPPFFVYVGAHAPHLPALPAPWYNDTFNEPALKKHYQTPNYNVSAPDHHWVVAQEGPIKDHEEVHIDFQFRQRWRSLLSVDDLVEGLVGVLDELSLSDSTYFFFSSDHGYNLGQLRLTGNKLHAYEQTLRIPMYVKGPRIPPGSTFALPSSNVDFAPTWLALAGIKNENMDGSSFVPYLLTAPQANQDSTQSVLTNPVKDWRDFHYAEYNSLGNWHETGHLIDDLVSHTFRALRFVNSSRYGDVMYAEYTSLVDWNFENYSSPVGDYNAYSYKFYEFFDLSKDPWQLKNTYSQISEQWKHDLHALISAEFACKGGACA